MGSELELREHESDTCADGFAGWERFSGEKRVDFQAVYCVGGWGVYGRVCERVYVEIGSVTLWDMCVYVTADAASCLFVV